jgi:hypothetical protein
MAKAGGCWNKQDPRHKASVEAAPRQSGKETLSASERDQSSHGGCAVDFGGIYEMSTKTGTELRREALKMVEQCICNDRQKTHGEAEDNFANIATIANVVLESKLSKPLDALDVALFSMCIKMGRCATSPRHLDNLIDHAGYALCGAGIVLREQEKWPNGIPDVDYQKLK